MTASLSTPSRVNKASEPGSFDVIIVGRCGTAETSMVMDAVAKISSTTRVVMAFGRATGKDFTIQEAAEMLLQSRKAREESLKMIQRVAAPPEPVVPLQPIKRHRVTREIMKNEPSYVSLPKYNKRKRKL